MLGTGAEGTNKWDTITKQSKLLHMRKNFKLIWKSPSDNSCCFRSSSKKKKNKAYLMYLVQVEILLHFRWIRCWARGPQIFQKYGYRRDVKREVPCWGDTNVRRHRQFSLPGNLVPGICVPLVSDMHMVTKHTCDRNAWLMSSISDLLPSRKANTTPTLDSQQIVSSNQH